MQITQEEPFAGPLLAATVTIVPDVLIFQCELVISSCCRLNEICPHHQFIYPQLSCASLRTGLESGKSENELFSSKLLVAEMLGVFGQSDTCSSAAPLQSSGALRNDYLISRDFSQGQKNNPELN